VNRLCGSGAQAIVSAAQALMLGDADFAVAGGAESMSRSPYAVPSARFGAKMGDQVMLDMMTGALTCPMGTGHMGVTAENVAKRYNISREAQDAFAMESQRRAAAAIAAGHFREQIVPVEVKTRKGVAAFEVDEHPKETSLEKLAGLKAVFQKGGSVTAGNASGINDGAAALVLARAEAAEAAGLPLIDIDTRDMDVPLSPLGERQSLSLGHWFAEQPPGERPNVVLCSPYLRARHTAELVCDAGGASASPDDFVVDERLREREFGVLDRLTRQGIEQEHPQQAEFRRTLGKFYHRPPGGESWCDVILRLRSALDTVALHYGGARVLVVAHQVVVLCMRYLVERMTEEQILGIDKAADILNCGICAFDFEVHELDCAPRLALWNHAAPLEEQGAPVTAAPDQMVGSR